MKPITVSATLNTRGEGLAVVKMLREFDETGEYLVHEAKRGLGWTVTGYICLTRGSLRELRKRFHEMGVLASVKDADVA